MACNQKSQKGSSPNKMARFLYCKRYQWIGLALIVDNLDQFWWHSYSLDQIAVACGQKSTPTKEQKIPIRLQVRTKCQEFLYCERYKWISNANAYSNCTYMEKNHNSDIFIIFQHLTLFCPGFFNPIGCGEGFAQTPPWRYQPPLCRGCTNQSQISWLFPIRSLLSSGKVIFHFFL